MSEPECTCKIYSPDWVPEGVYGKYVWDPGGWRVPDPDCPVDHGEEPNEKWKPVAWYEGFYDVSNCGRVRALRNRGRNYDQLRERPLILAPFSYKPGPDGAMYQGIRLRGSEKRKAFWVHRLVAEAFLGVIPDGWHVDHINSNRSDNRVENLRIIPAAENVRQGHHLISGEHSYLAKLNAEQVKEIRRRASRGDAHKPLAAEFGVSANTIGDIVRRRSWKNV